MHIAAAGTGTRRRAPIPAGPIVEMLTPDAAAGGQPAVVHMEFPAGAGLPEHDHGASHIVLVSLTGTVELRQGERVGTLAQGAAAHIPAGERISLRNPGDQPATVMMVATPPDFVAHLASWPAA